LEPTKWKIFGERLVDENPFIRLSIASVGLPDRTEFEQYVIRMRRTATTAHRSATVPGIQAQHSRLSSWPGRG
jgi:hypothetical protein